MLNTLHMIIGEPACHIETYSLYPGKSALDFALQLEMRASANLDDEYVVITDVRGGSVHTSMLQALHSKNIYLFVGMNLPLVLELVTSTGSIADKKQYYVQAGREGIAYVENMLVQDSESDDF